MATMAIRLATVAAVVAVLLGVAGEPYSRAEAAGGNPYLVRTTRFCRGHVFGSAASASFKLSVNLKAAGSEDVAGVPYAMLHSPVQPYHELKVTNDASTVLHPGDSVGFVVIAKNLNLSQAFTIEVGLKEPQGSDRYETYSPWYASPQDIPAC